MNKKYFKLEQITKDEYLEIAADYLKRAGGSIEDEKKWIDTSISGSLNVSRTTTIAYTEDDSLEVPLQELEK